MKRKLFLIGTLALMVAGGIFWSCQKDETLTNPEEGLMLKSDYVDADCNVNCIDPANPEYFEMTDNKSETAGTNTVKYTYVAYNTLNEFVIDITYEKTAGTTNGKATITVSFESEAPMVFTDVALGSTKQAKFSLPTAWKACDEVKFSITGDGVGDDVLFTDVLYELFGECTDCETKLTGEAVSCGTSREANFTFTSADELSYVKIQGGLTNFTGADAVVNVPTGYTVNQWTPGGSSNRVISVEGTASCTPLVINITWSSTNSGGVITGDWTAKDANGVELGSVAGLSCL